MEGDILHRLKEYFKNDARDITNWKIFVCVCVFWTFKINSIYQFSPFFSSSSGASVVAIDNKIEQAMVCTD